MSTIDVRPFAAACFLPAEGVARVRAEPGRGNAVIRRRLGNATIRRVNLEAIPAYRSRPVQLLGIERTAGWRIKVYGIAATAERPRQQLIDAARKVAAATLPAPDADGAHGVGFVVVHDARPACFVLVNWWVRGYDLFQRYFRSPLQRPEQLEPLTTPAVGCVWELAVTGHERHAWVRHVLTRPADADIEAYLADAFEGEARDGTQARR